MRNINMQVYLQAVPPCPGNVKVIKGGMNGSSVIVAIIMHGLKDLAETVSEKNQNQMLRLDLAETENVSIVSFSSPNKTSHKKSLQLLLLLACIPQTFIFDLQGESDCAA